MSVADMMRRMRVVPVIVLDRAEDAVPLARTFVAAGIGGIEITLRTPAGMEAIRRALGEVEGIAVGAGTVTRVAELTELQRMGAAFAVSPGCPRHLLDAAIDMGIAYLPGVVTPTELMTAMEAGLSCLKFFPAEASGGAAVLKAWSSVFRDLAMVPTGGIDMKNAADYFAVPMVAAIGCSWVAPQALIAGGHWDEIGSRCRQILALGRV